MDNNLTNVKERILYFANYKGVSYEKFIKEIGMSYASFKGLAKERPINSDALVNILSIYPEINSEWLLIGKGEMIKGNDYEKYVIEPISSRQKGREVLKDIQGIPLYEIEASAGLTVFFDNQNTQVPLDYISVPNAPKCDGALFVRGDSMYPLLKAGDIVCYKTISDIKNILWGEIYILDIDSGDDQFITIKYVQKSDLGDEYIKLVSQNQHHQPKDEPIKNIRALAMVKLSIRYNVIS
ncbi:Peptidase S24-like [Apibacter mensalis]|uniref:Peptidase S24-like n=1 Tax=Apibacter mensalis TaxID=1586267 RepID=A0A0X3ALD8_9FLAO|nr:S24 family peptidase [Apibacter mensalis]CVK15190.1 Peptidase S24-like [Apibacter mensalis]